MEISIELPTNDFFGGFTSDDLEPYDLDATLARYIETVEQLVSELYPDAQVDVGENTGTLNALISVDADDDDVVEDVEDAVNCIIDNIDLSDDEHWVPRSAA